MTPHAQEAGLRDGLRALRLAASEDQVRQLLMYLDLLAKWSRVYNLTALRSPDEILTHHLLDSLAAVPPLMAHLGGASAKVLDVGSGAGLPGAVIAIMCPGVTVDCVDAVAKKAAFVQQSAGALRLPNLRGLHSRVEAVPGPYDLITSRAFASLADFARISAHCLSHAGVWMAMKGKRPDEELAQLPAGVVMFHVEQLHVPGVDAERCLVWMRQSTR